MKRTGIILLLCMLINHVYSQVNRQKSDSLLSAIPQDSSFIYIYGRLVVFPPDTLDRMENMTVSVRFGDSLKWEAISLQKNGDFCLQIEKSESKRIIIDINGKRFSQEGAYYPVEIKNINLEQDSLYLGIIPAMPDPFGYFGEWGSSVKKHIFDRKVYFWSNTVMFMEERLKYENKLNTIYNSFCHDCDTIFTTDIFSWRTSSWPKKQHVSSEEKRKLLIDHQELLSMSEYFSFNYAHHDSLAKGFVNFMKRLPDSTFCDKFNKAVNNYNFPRDYVTPDSIIIYSNGQLLGYEEDSVPVFFAPNHPELSCHLYERFRDHILNSVVLSEEEMDRINNELLFLIQVHRNCKITELKLLSLVDSETRQKIEPVLIEFKRYKLMPASSRFRAHGFKAALYIDLSENNTKFKNTMH